MIYLKAFVIGGLICAVGQILIDRTKLTPARIMVLFLLAGMALSAVGLYEPLVKFAGSGAAVPISGFGHVLANGVREAIQKDGPIGILTGGLTAGAAGIPAAIFFGLLAALFAKPKEKQRKICKCAVNFLPPTGKKSIMCYNKSIR